MGDYQVSKSLVVQSAWKSVGTNSFVDDLGVEIQSHPSLIGLDEFCTNGGSIGDVCVEDLELEEIDQTGIIHGSFSISFEESYFGGCRDIEWADCYSGTMHFSLNPSTQELTIVDEDIHEVIEEESSEEIK